MGINERAGFFLPVLSIIFSVLLSHLSFGFLLFSIPVLLVCLRYDDLIKSVSICIIMSILVLFWSLFAGLSGFSLILFVFYLQVCISVIIYVSLKKFSDSVLRKIVISSLSSVIISIGFVFYLYLSSNSEDFLMSLANEFFTVLSILEVNFGSATNNYVYQLIESYDFLRIISCVISFIFSLFSFCFSVLASESSISRSNLVKGDSVKEINLSFMKVPSNYFILLLLCCCLFIISITTDFFQLWMQLIFLFLSIWFASFYLINGISLCVYYIKKKRPNFTAFTVLMILFIFMFIPIFNLLILIFLVLFGIMERWIKFR